MAVQRSSARPRATGYTLWLVAELLVGLLIYAVVQAGFRLLCLWEWLTVRRSPPPE